MMREKIDAVTILTAVLVGITIYAGIKVLRPQERKLTRSEAMDQIAEVAPDRAPSVVLSPNTLSVVDEKLTGVFVKLHKTRPPELLRIEDLSNSDDPDPDYRELAKTAKYYGFDFWVEPMDPRGGEIRYIPEAGLSKSDESISIKKRGAPVETENGKYLLFLEKISSIRWKLYARPLN